MRNTQKEILTFWFEDTNPQQWFQKNTDFDEDIRARFESDYQLAIEDIYDGWMETAKGCLALILLLDQFPRNMYRDSPKMVASDHKALAVAKHAISKKFDTMLSTDEKAFMYLPYEHSEDIEDQDISVSLFQNLKDDNPIYYDYAVRHYDVIRKYGRFPHRNVILGRQNTKMEEDYLSDPQAGF